MKIRLVLLAAAALAVSACSATPQNTALLASACDGAAASLKAATALDKAGKLTASQRQAVSIAAAAINGPCGQPTAPTDLNGALASVSAAALSLAPIVGAAK